MSFFRYPGGKQKLRELIMQRLIFSAKKNIEYREPFFGGGSIGLYFLRKGQRVWINDKDIGVACLWTSVIHYPDQLIQKIRMFKPSVYYFDEYKNYLLGLKKFPDLDDEIINCGFMKLAIHQISYSGLGTKSGGPLGGRQQKSKYKIDCRWSPKYMCEKVQKYNRFFSQLDIRENRCTNYDFKVLLMDDGPALFYLDPPYFVKGNDLYECGFSLKDHEELATLLRVLKEKWVLSYDCCEFIERLYWWSNIEKILVTYNITTSRKKYEFIISPVVRFPLTERIPVVVL